jgi:hypothetical protein
MTATSFPNASVLRDILPGLALRVCKIRGTCWRGRASSERFDRRVLGLSFSVSPVMAKAVARRLPGRDDGSPKLKPLACASFHATHTPVVLFPDHNSSAFIVAPSVATEISGRA